MVKVFVFSPPASAAYNKAAAIFITTAEYSCDWTQFGRTTNKAGVFRPKTLSHAPCAYGTTSEQVLWLAPYTPHGMTFVSCLLSFPMTGFRLRTQKQLSAYTDSYRRGFAPHSLFTGYAFLCGITDTLCVLLH